MTKALLTVFCLVEIGAGLLLVLAPDVLTRILFGTELDTPTALISARVAGIALLSLVVACWLSRNEARGDLTSAVVAGMSVYNVGVVAMLAYSVIVNLIGPGLWAAITAHAILALWCFVCLRTG